MLMQLYLAEYFQIFDPFYRGLFGSFYLLLLVFLFSYLGSRGISKKPFEDAVEMSVPVYVAGFFLHVLAPHPFIAGILTIIAYFAVVKVKTKIRPVPFATLVVYFTIMFSVLSLLEPWLRDTLLLFSLAAAYFRGSLRLWDKEDVEAPEGKKKK
jgi:hypothetical protein